MTLDRTHHVVMAFFHVLGQTLLLVFVQTKDTKVLLPHPEIGTQAISASTGIAENTAFVYRNTKLVIAILDIAVVTAKRTTTPALTKSAAIMAYARI